MAKRKPAVPCLMRPSPRINEPWQPMCDAPRDGTAILALIPNERKPRVISFECLEGPDEDGTGGVFTWMIHNLDRADHRPPQSWTNGICWDENEFGKPSAQPKAWRPLEEDEE